METKSKKSTLVNIFALASFLHDMGSDIVFSVWPIFVTDVLKANMAILGFIDGVGEAIVSLSQAVSGYLSDRIRRRKIFVWLGYLFGGIARIGYALAPTWQWLLPFRILDRSGKIRGSPRDAIISEISTKENRGRNFGLLRSADNLGAVVGIILSIVLLGVIGYKPLFLLAAVPSVIAVFLLIIFIREEKPVQEKLHKTIRFRGFSSDLKMYTISSVLFALGGFSYSFLLVFAKRFGFQTIHIPALYLSFTLVATLFSLPLGKLSDAIGRKKVLYLSFLFWALVSILFLFWNSYIGIIIGFIFYGLHRAAIEPVQKSFVAELSPKEFLASSLGGFQMAVGLSALPGSFIAGVLWDNFSIQAPFYFSLVLTSLALVLLTLVKEKK
ncbi:MFS transporter [Candidatus Roizmanbacteria bacterium]|nr:MFS transporter [Candidatus Roizmanbacteria bacterium]